MGRKLDEDDVIHTMCQRIVGVSEDRARIIASHIPTAEPSDSDCWSNDNRPNDDSIDTNSSRYGTDRTTDDTISRQAAIDAIMANCIWENEYNLTSSRIKNAIEKLPSTQPEPVRINLNEPIKVKLTDWGKEIYYHQYDRTNQIAGREICKPKFPEEDENGYTEFQLWCFIELYGEHMGMTLPNVIKPLEVVYEGRTDEN